MKADRPTRGPCMRWRAAPDAAFAYTPFSDKRPLPPPPSILTPAPHGCTGAFSKLHVDRCNVVCALVLLLRSDDLPGCGKSANCESEGAAARGLEVQPRFEEHAQGRS
eukprot:4894514-Pleurochrysis_carterae.AAC.1